MGRTAIDEALLSGVNLHAGAEHSDGTFPHNFWISPNGNDGAGNGSFNAPYLTVRRGIRQTLDGRGDRLIVTPGSYAETIDIGSGSTNGGNTNGGYAKRNLQILGAPGVHNGITQIVGDGATAAATLRVLSGYLRGFRLADIELDVTTVTQPALHLETDSGEDATATAGSMRFTVQRVSVRSAQPNVGMLFEGATLGDIEDCVLFGPTIGIALTGSGINLPNDLSFKDIDFADCVTADIAAVNTATDPTTIRAVALTNIWFERMKHRDRGGTPVTNYVNLPAGATYINVNGVDCFWARDVADDTLLVLAADVVFLGHSAAGVESIIGA